MKKRISIVLSSMMVFGLFATALAFNSNSQSLASSDMSKVPVIFSGDSCCQPGADCCKGGTCCHKKAK